MIIRQSSYYHKFRCLAGSCPDSCCQEWDVEVDGTAAGNYLALPGELGDDLRKHLYREDGRWYLKITQGRCPMWRQDGLCRIQAQLGEGALCQVCREFPRLRHDYGDFMELGLELSCPEAARLILTTPPAPMTEQEIPGGSQPEYDRECMEILLRTRGEALELLQRHSLEEALPLLLLYGYRVQDELDGGEASTWDAREELKFAAQMGQAASWEPLRRFYSQLEILTQRWKDRLNTQPQQSAFPPALKNLIHCGIERYWLQAVSDYDLICRVKMLLAGALLVGHLGGNLIETAQLYSKEIDNSTENLEAILDAAYTHPALTDQYLLGLMKQVHTTR